MKVTDDILAALAAATTDGTRLVLAGPQMDPKLYQRVNEVLEAVGGRWTKTARAHLFPTDAAEAIAPVIATGHVVTLKEKRTQAQYFPTPDAVVQRLIELADLQPGMEVLEPSAGSGAIATAVASQGAYVDCFEQDPGYAAVLTDIGVARSVTVADFLTAPAEPRYDRVVMNPPFTRQADVAHVQHALGFLKPNGLLVAVMSHATTFQKGAAASFRALVEARGGQVEALPDGAFAASGTGVRTIIVSIPATRPAGAQPLVWPSQRQAETSADEFLDPAEIAKDIADSLREATKIMDGIARDLARPVHRAPKPAASVTTLPLPAGSGGQLSFDELGEAS